MNEVRSGLLEVKDLRKHFTVRGGFFRLRVGINRAVDGVSFNIPKGETLGLVGESGCGKSTLAKTLIRLGKPTAGSIKYDGQEISHFSSWRLKSLRKEFQMVFQNPRESLNPKMSVAELIREPLTIQGMGKPWQRNARVAELLDLVELPRKAMRRFPSEFSAGQRQRISIARALALSPKLLILDEPVSALDVSIRAQIMNLLLRLQRDLGMSYLFISHDLSVVKHMSDRVAVMYLGKIVEMAPAEVIHQQPMHAYTKSLLAAVPNPNPFEQQAMVALQGDVPSSLNPPAGCAFGYRVGHIRYPESITHEPVFEEVSHDHWVLRCPCCVQ